MNNEKPISTSKKIAIVILPILLAVVATVAVAIMMSGGMNQPTPEVEVTTPTAGTPADVPVAVDPEKETESYSQGLSLSQNPDGSYSVVGLGSCADKIVKIPKTTADGAPVTAIGDGAFASVTGVDEVVLPSGIVKIGEGAFKGSSIKTARIVGSVMSIGTGAFADCQNLTAISVDGANPMFASRGGVLFDRDMSTLICYPSGKTDSTYTIPESVTELAAMAFTSCPSLKTLKYDGNAKEWAAVRIGSGNTLLGKLTVEVDMTDK